MRSVIEKCVDCNVNTPRSERSYLCQDCFDKLLSEKLRKRDVS